MPSKADTYICTSKRALGWRVVAIAGFGVLAGCEGTVTLDLGTTQAADPRISQVLVDLEGIELTGDSGTERLTFRDPVRMNLVEFTNGQLFRLFTDEELPDGRYTGVRLLFEDDADDLDDIVLVNGAEYDLRVLEGTSSQVSFTVDKDDSSKEDVVLTLDLRQSLSFDDGNDVFSLTPVVRAARVEGSGQITGSVTANCPAGTSLSEGGAVYLFSGEDRVPDDRDNADEEPYLTAATVVGVSSAIASYSFAHVPEGDYTLALTCEGDEDDPATNDTLRFQGTTNVEVRAERTVTRDLD